eukprot:gene14481-biopygen4498
MELACLFRVVRSDHRAVSRTQPQGRRRVRLEEGAGAPTRADARPHRVPVVQSSLQSRDSSLQCDRHPRKAHSHNESEWNLERSRDPFGRAGLSLLSSGSKVVKSSGGQICPLADFGGLGDTFGGLADFWRTLADWGKCKSAGSLVVPPHAR